MLQDLNAHLIEMAAQATERSRVNPIHAEIVPGCTAKWHVLITQANCEQIAAGHLIGRGFGTYLPQFSRLSIERGRKKWRTANMFPGYLFLFVWDIHHHWRRVTGCTGISGVLSTIEGTPVTVGDEHIDRMQVHEFNSMIRSGRITSDDKPSRSRDKGKRRIRELRRQIAEGNPSDHKVTISTKSYWDNLTDLDDAGRNRLLHRALGLDS